jgi:hypothetical protein
MKVQTLYPNFAEGERIQNALRTFSTIKDFDKLLEG